MNETEEVDKNPIMIVLGSYLKAIIIVSLSIISALYLKKCLDLSDYPYIQLIGTAIPTIGTLGFLSWNMHLNTLDGKSFPEKLNQAILSASYVIGIVLFILGSSI